MSTVITFPLPDNVAPVGTRCLQVTIPDDDQYQTLLLAVVNTLSYWMTYDRDPLHRAALVANLFKKVMKTWTDCGGNPVQTIAEGEDFDDMSQLTQIVEDSDGCEFEYRCCVDGTWIQVARKSDLATNPPGTGNQPLPGGGTSQFCKTLYCNQVTVIPAAVNTGDVITVVSASGDWSDQFGRWLCIDGNLFFIECTGVGGASGASGDVLMSANHLSAVVKFSTGYYALYPGGVLTVPAGVFNEQPEILANKPTVNSGSGSIDVCVEIQNNQSVTWSHTFDFTVSPAGWSLAFVGGSTIGQWVPGVGWQNTDELQSPTYWFRGVVIERTGIAAFELLTMSINYDYSVGNYDCPCYGLHLQSGVGSPSNDYVNVDHTGVTTGTNKTMGGSNNQISQTYMRCEMNTDANASSNSGFVGSDTVKSITITGRGTQPTW